MATPDSDDKLLTEDEDKLLTEEEVAAMLRMTPARDLRADAQRRPAASARLGRYVCYRRSAITEWLATIETDATLARAGRRR
jgi:predicted DNA-binding transcriptional regulator AlpA